MEMYPQEVSFIVYNNRQIDYLLNAFKKANKK